jgi:hypothetical protein
VDSTKNGAAIGLAMGTGLVFAVYQLERRLPDGTLKGMGTFGALVFGVPASVIAGVVVDRNTNEPIYERRLRAARVTLAPILLRGQNGIIAQVHFSIRAD